MASRSVNRNNIIAGAFLVACLIGAIAISVWISGAQERLKPTTAYTIRFNLAEGAFGIKLESPVNLGGQKVGHVTDVDIARGPDGIPTGIDVRVRVQRDVALREDAQASLIVPLLGTLSSINISSVGSGALLPAGGALDGHVAPPAFLAQAGYGPAQVRQLQGIFEDASSMVKRADALVRKVDDHLDPTLTLVKGSLEDAKAITAEFRGKAPAWTQSVDSVLAKANAAADKFEPIMTDAQRAVADAKETVAGVRRTVDDNRARFDRITANVESITGKVDTETVALVNDALRSGKEGADRFSDIARRVDSLIQEEVPTLRHAIANARLASDQLKLTTVEVRRNPWRLLYKPGAKELEAELLYDAARSYAEAVSDLRASSESLEAAAGARAGSGDAANTAPSVLSAPDRENLQQLRVQLDEAFTKYKTAEGKLLQRMMEHGGRE